MIDQTEQAFEKNGGIQSLIVILIFAVKLKCFYLSPSNEEYFMYLFGHQLKE